MTRLAVFLVVIIGAVGFSTSSHSAAAPAAVFTAAQAEAGRTELRNNAFGTCSDCHMNSLLGRVAGDGDDPPVSTLAEGFQKTIQNMRGNVPALVGPRFQARWRTRSTKALAADFQKRFNPLTEKIQLDIVAYILQLNGAVSGSEPLTRETDVEIGSLLGSSADR